MPLAVHSENNNTTRQAINDIIKKGENKLLEFESNLGIMKKTMKQEKQIQIILAELGKIKDNSSDQVIEKILNKYSYPKEKMDRVLSCVYNHRSSKNATNIEDLCVADADIIAHFDNIPMLFNSAYKRNNINLNEVRNWLKEGFEKDYNDLSDRTKESFKEQYNLIYKIVIGEDI